MHVSARAVLLLAFFTAACGDSAGRDATSSSQLPTFGTPGSELPSSGAPAPTANDTAVPAAATPGASNAGGSESPGSELPLGMAGADGAGPGAAPQALSLPRSTPEAEGLSSAGVLALVGALDDLAGEIHSMMLVRHGKVVAEAWWAPYAAEDIHVLYSATKSFNSTAVGFAVEEGLLGIDELVLPHFPEDAPATPAPQMQNMRVRDLLTMSTGHESDPLNAMRARTDGQWVRGFLETAVPRQPGTFFFYNSSAAYMLGALVQKLTGMSVEEYLEPRLFQPLGISGQLWGKSPEGVNLTDGGLSVKTEDLAKFGLLYLQGGMWNGEQVVPAEWATAATASQISTGNGTSNWGHGYGYQFWRSQVGYRADGSLGQFSFVLPEQDIVLAITSGTSDTNGVMNVVWQNLLPAVSAGALPEDPAALAALGARMTRLAVPVPAGAMSSSRVADVSLRRYATAQNPQGIQAIQIDFSGATPVLAIEDADGKHSIQVGLGQWVRGRTGFKKRINELFDTPEQGIAAIGAWTAEDTFQARLCFNETPYTMTASFKFEAERVLADMSYNVRWGNAKEAQIIGTR